MGISLDRNSRIAGYRPSVFKDALRGFQRTKSPGSMIDLKTIFPLRRDGAIVFEECLDRGLIDPATLKLTEAGETIARAKAKSRTPLPKAHSVLNEFLERIEALNRDPDAVQQLDQLWLFGSLMRGEETVGDIDLALTMSRRPRFATDHDGRCAHIEKLLAQHGDASVRWEESWIQEGWLTNRALYGTRRHPLLAGVQDGTSDLESLGVPCRLIYDRTRGGKVDDPILPRHPKSRGRSNDLSPPAEMPDLTPAPVRPMDARWVAGFGGSGMVSPYDIFRGWTDDAHALFPHYPDGLRVVGDNHNLRNYPWTPKRLKKQGLDGRNAVALINATAWWGTSLVLRRHIEIDTAHWTLHAGFSDIQFHRARKHVHLVTLPDMAAVTALILAVDAERMLRRAAELSDPPAIRIRISDVGLSEDLRSHFAEVVRDHLDNRAIRKDGFEGKRRKIW